MADEILTVRLKVAVAVPAPPPVVDEDTDDEHAEVGCSASDDTASVVENPADFAVHRAPTLRDASRAMDDVDVERFFTLMASVMRSVPRFLHGPFRNAMTMVLEEISGSVEEDRVARGWKVFLMLPKMLLHRCQGGKIISREKLLGLRLSPEPRGHS